MDSKKIAQHLELVIKELEDKKLTEEEKGKHIFDAYPLHYTKKVTKEVFKIIHGYIKQGATSEDIKKALEIVYPLAQVRV